MPEDDLELICLTLEDTLELYAAIIGGTTGQAAALFRSRSGLEGALARRATYAHYQGADLALQAVLAAGVGLRRAAGVAFASDTVSITTMEIVDNAFILIVPGAMADSLADGLFWWSLGLSLVIAFVLTVSVNRWLISRGRGHAVLHELQAH